MDFGIYPITLLCCRFPINLDTQNLHNDVRFRSRAFSLAAIRLHRRLLDEVSWLHSPLYYRWQNGPRNYLHLDSSWRHSLTSTLDAIHQCKSTHFCRPFYHTCEAYSLSIRPDTNCYLDSVLFQLLKTYHLSTHRQTWSHLLVWGHPSLASCATRFLWSCFDLHSYSNPLHVSCFLRSYLHICCQAHPPIFLCLLFCYSSSLLHSLIFR